MPYRGTHREDEVGSPRYSDDDCLASERAHKMIQHQIGKNRWNEGVARNNYPECSE